MDAGSQVHEGRTFPWRQPWQVETNHCRVGAINRVPTETKLLTCSASSTIDHRRATVLARCGNRTLSGRLTPVTSDIVRSTS